jgi:hypothetical protein
MSEPFIRPTRKERAKDDEWDQVYDVSKRGYTDGPTREKRGVKIKSWRLNIKYSPKPKSGEGNPRALQDYAGSRKDPRCPRDHGLLSPRSSSQGHMNIYCPEHSRDIPASPRSSSDHIKIDDARGLRDYHPRYRERSRGRDTTHRASKQRHHRRQHKPSHPKELPHNRFHHRSSNIQVNKHNKPLIPETPPTPLTPLLRDSQKRDICGL